jgi:Leucine-rich repeat (LRR) protein
LGLTLLSANQSYLNKEIETQLLKNTLVLEEDDSLHFSSSKYNGLKLLELAQYSLAFIIDNLEQIDLSNLQSFEGLERLTNIKEVRFFDNNLKQLPRALFQLKELKRLYIRVNPKLDFEQLCLELKAFKHLEGLYLENNELEIVPKNLKLLPHLKHLRFNNRQLRSPNKIQKIPSTLLSFQQLESLHFERNPIKEIPPNLFSFAKNQLKSFTLGAYPFKKGSDAKTYLKLFKIHGIKTAQED